MAVATPTQPNTTPQANPLGYTPPKPLNPQADLTREYVSGGTYSALLASYYQALPQYIDDITADFGSDLYERMMLDDAVYGAIDYLRLAVLSDGMQLIGRITDKDAPDFERSEEIKEFCNRNTFEWLDRPIDEILGAMLDALAFGNKIAEIVYQHPDAASPDNGKLCLKSLKVKPRRSVAFVVDAFNNVAGLLVLLPNQGSSIVATQGLIGVGTGPDSGKDIPTNLLPREKFFIFSYRPKDSDPRGTSMLRPAYDPWWLKVQVNGEDLKYMTQFAAPTVVGYTAPDAQGGVATDSLGNVTLDDANQTIPLSPEDLMLQALLNMRNGSAMAFTNGSKVETIVGPQNGFQAFEAFLERQDKRIARAIYHQTLATGEAGHQTGAATNAHQDVLGMVVQYCKNMLAHSYRTDVLYQLVKLNYSEADAIAYCPNVSFSSTEAQDFAANLTAVGNAYRDGYIHESQMPGIDRKVGLPERDMAQMQQEKQDAQQMKLQLAQAQMEAQKQQPGSDGQSSQDTPPSEDNSQGNDNAAGNEADPGGNGGADNQPPNKPKAKQDKQVKPNE